MLVRRLHSLHGAARNLVEGKAEKMSLEIKGEAPPILVEVVRGEMVESRHRASLAIVDKEGKIVAAWGDIERPIYGRSAIKPLLAVSLIESGASDHFQVSDREVALACASHNGEVEHVDAVIAWLSRLNLTIEDLECGPQPPDQGEDKDAMIREGKKPTRAHNNCSGKHAGFLTVARHLGYPTKGYIQRSHPVQQLSWKVLAEVCGIDSFEGAASGIDGCGIPVIGMSLAGLALGMARMANPTDLSPKRSTACRRVIQAMMAHPFYVGGTNRFCTEVMKVLRGRAAIKPGAEGVYSAALPERGLGIALKIEDGAARAAEIAMGQALKYLGIIEKNEEILLTDRFHPSIKNWAGAKTGFIRPAGSFVI